MDIAYLIIIMAIQDKTLANIIKNKIKVSALSIQFIFQVLSTARDKGKKRNTNKVAEVPFISRTHDSIYIREHKDPIKKNFFKELKNTFSNNDMIY